MLCPQLASPITLNTVGRYIVDEAYLAEQKLDGHRVMVIGPGGDAPAAITRNGTTYTRALPTAVRTWRAPVNLDTSGFVLDGELVGDTYWVFDFLLANGDLNNTPLADRRVILEQFLGMCPGAPFRLIPQARTTVEKDQLMQRAVAENLEGLIFKRTDSVYLSGGRSPYCLKAKFVVTADVFVMDVRDDGKESARLGIVRDGQCVEIGRCSLIGKPAVKVGDVVEVRYLYANSRTAPRLYQPTLLRVRTDKAMHECDGIDLKFTNKAVLEAL